MKLVGSANSLQALEAFIKKKWNWSMVDFFPVDEKTWEVVGFNGKIKELIVRKTGNRYRLEFVGDVWFLYY